MSNVIDFNRCKHNPTLGCKIHGQELRFVSSTNRMGETMYTVHKKQKNGKFKEVCSFDDWILISLLDAKNVECRECDEQN